MKQVIAVTCLFIVFQTPAFSQQTENETKFQSISPKLFPPKLKANIEQWVLARESQYIETLEKLTATNFTFTDKDGSIIKRSEFLSFAKLNEIDLQSAMVKDFNFEISNTNNVIVQFVIERGISNEKDRENAVLAKQQNVQKKWSNFVAQMERRADLIPNLSQFIIQVKISESEIELMGEIAQARSVLLNEINSKSAQTNVKTKTEVKTVVEANNIFDKTIRRLKNLSAKYPKLKSSDLFQNLLSELAGAENRIAVARSDYFQAANDLEDFLNPHIEKTTAYWTKINRRWLLVSERREKLEK
jgi:hypothetical protein